MKEAVFKYKCRLCGKMFGNTCCSPKLAFPILTDILLEIDFTKVRVGMKPKIVEHHYCFPEDEESQIGVADLIGYEIRETE